MSLGIMGIVIIDGVINMALLALDIGIMSPISLLVGLAIMLPLFAVGTRRLHDIGRGG